MVKRSLLIAYQIATGLSDAGTGLFVVAQPEWTLRQMGLHVPADTLPFISYIGVFVLGVGVACLYGAWLAGSAIRRDRLEVVWLLTAVTRGLVAIFLSVKIASGILAPGWSTVAVTDGAIGLVQAVGLARGWARDAPARDRSG